MLVNWEVGGGLWTYYVGFAHYLQDHHDLSNVVFVGHSAGVEASYWLALEIPMRHVWAKYREFIQLVDTCATKALWNWSHFSRQGHLIFIADMPTEENGAWGANHREVSHITPCSDELLERLRKRYVCAASKLVWAPWRTGNLLPRLEKVYWGAYSSHAAAVNCALSSYNIPLITAPLSWPFASIVSDKGRCLAVDSWLSHLSNEPHVYAHPPSQTITLDPRMFHTFPAHYR